MSLEILDVNDNSPEFPTTSAVVELLESSAVGTALTVDSASDRDTIQFGVARYDLLAEDEDTAAHFTLKVRHFAAPLNGVLSIITRKRCKPTLGITVTPHGLC